MRVSEEVIKKELNPKANYILFDVTVFCYCQGKETYFYEKFIAEETDDLSNLRFVSIAERLSVDCILTESITYDEAKVIYELGLATKLPEGVSYFDVYKDEEPTDEEVELLDDDQMWRAFC